MLKIILLNFFIFMLIIFVFFWGFRFKPLGPDSRAGVYIYDRLDGNIYWLAGNQKIKVKQLQPVTDAGVLKQLEKQ